MVYEMITGTLLFEPKSEDERKTYLRYKSIFDNKWTMLSESKDNSL
jgi:hypothetical protein